MARKKNRNGFRHVGRSVDTEPVTLTKDVVINKAANTDIASGGFTTLAFDLNGKAIREFQGRKVNTLPDDDNTINTLLFFQAGILVGDPTTDRSKDLPSVADFFSNVLPTLLSAFDFCIVNEDVDHMVTIGGGTGTSFSGSRRILPGTSGFFRAIRLSTPAETNDMRVVRLA